jgi:uncharacterized protein
MVTDRSMSPRSLDVAAFAQAEGVLAGEWPATALSRLADAGAPEAPAEGWAPVRWRVSGRLRPVLGGEPEVWLNLQVQAQVHPTCQRCLQPVSIELDIDRPFRFVRDEAQAAELDAESEDDVLVLSRRFDVQEWVEDELLLALPIVPLHDACPQPLPVSDAPVIEEVSARPNPFAVLQALKDKAPGTGST